MQIAVSIRCVIEPDQSSSKIEKMRPSLHLLQIHSDWSGIANLSGIFLEDHLKKHTQEEQENRKK